MNPLWVRDALLDQLLHLLVWYLGDIKKRTQCGGFMWPFVSGPVFCSINECNGENGAEDGSDRRATGSELGWWVNTESMLKLLFTFTICVYLMSNKHGWHSWQDTTWYQTIQTSVLFPSLIVTQRDHSSSLGSPCTGGTLASNTTQKSSFMFSLSLNRVSTWATAECRWYQQDSSWESKLPPRTELCAAQLVGNSWRQKGQKWVNEMWESNATTCCIAFSQYLPDEPLDY